MPKKGYQLLLNLNEHNLYTILIGADKEYAKSKNTLILNRTVQSKLKEFYQLSDLFILPSNGEGFPLSIQEAMASGLPIVTTRNPGYEKLLNKDIVEYTKPNTKQINKTIQALMKNKKKLSSMGKKARTYVVENFSWNKNIKNIFKIYKEFSL